MSEHYVSLAEVSLAEARKQLGELLARVTYGDERVVVTKHGKPAAAIVSIKDLARLGDAELAQEALAQPEPGPQPEPWAESVDLPATRSQVWWAIMDPRRRTQWWPLVEIDPEVGCEFTQWSAGDTDGLSGRVSEYEDGERVQVQWADGTHTTVELQETDGDTTTVTVTHSAGQPPPGWSLTLGALRAYVA